jgi:hypothetical protein
MSAIKPVLDEDENQFLKKYQSRIRPRSILDLAVSDRGRISIPDFSSENQSANLTRVKHRNMLDEDENQSRISRIDFHPRRAGLDENQELIGN